MGEVVANPLAMSSASPPPDTSSDSWTVARLLDWTRTRFEEVGIDSPRVDAEHLLAFALECSRMNLYVDHHKVVEADERTRFRELVRRRLAREPVAYIEGKRGFHALDLELHVDGRVLIPRPETELLVDWVLEDLLPPGATPPSVPVEPEPEAAPEPVATPSTDGAIEEPVFVPDPGYGTQAGLQGVAPEDVASEPAAQSETETAPESEAEAEAAQVEAPAVRDDRSVLDVGTGSGAIALALKRARPTMRVAACDVSEEAVTVARENAERLGLDIALKRSDLLLSVRPPPNGWSAITANLPYIPAQVWEGLAPEVQRFEPRLALVGGADGLDIIRRLVATAKEQLAPGAGLYLEIGYDQRESVPELMRAAGYVDVVLRKDHSGHPRIVCGRAPR